MAERGSRPRKRYVAFTVEVHGGAGAPTRGAMVDALDEACGRAGLPAERRLTAFNGRAGIVRCVASERDVVVAALSGIASAGGAQVRVVPVVTSGTIKKAKAHLGEGRGQ